MQIHPAKESNKIHAVVRDEREFTLDDSIGQFPVRLAVQTYVVDLQCLETSGMSDSNQRLMQTFVDQKSHALLSRVLSENDFRAAALFRCHGRELGRPRRGNARIYRGAMAIFSLLKVG